MFMSRFARIAFYARSPPGMIWSITLIYFYPHKKKIVWSWKKEKKKLLVSEIFSSAYDSVKGIHQPVQPSHTYIVMVYIPISAAVCMGWVTWPHFNKHIFRMGPPMIPFWWMDKTKIINMVTKGGPCLVNCPLKWKWLLQVAYGTFIKHLN